MTTVKKFLCYALMVCLLTSSVIEASRLEKLAGLALIIGGIAGGLGGGGGFGGGKKGIIPIPIKKKGPKITHHTEILPVQYGGYNEFHGGDTVHHIGHIGHGLHGGHGW